MSEGAHASLSFRRPGGEWVPVGGASEVVADDGRSFYSGTLTGTIEATIESFTLHGTIERHGTTRSRNFVRFWAKGHLADGSRFTLIDGYSTRPPRRRNRRERKRRGKV